MLSPEFKQQNKRVARHQPCPMRGRDDCMVYTTWEGQPAWWIDGDIWVAKEDNSKVNQWPQNLDKARKAGKLPRVP